MVLPRAFGGIDARRNRRSEESTLGGIDVRRVVQIFDVIYYHGLRFSKRISWRPSDSSPLALLQLNCARPPATLPNEQMKERVNQGGGGGGNEWHLKQIQRVCSLERIVPLSFLLRSRLLVFKLELSRSPSGGFCAGKGAGMRGSVCASVCGSKHRRCNEQQERLRQIGSQTVPRVLSLGTKRCAY